MSLIALLLLPLIASAATALVRSRRAMEAIHLISAVLMFHVTLLIAGQALAQGSVSWSDGFLYADHLSALVALLTAFVYMVSAPYAIGYLRRDALDEALGENPDGRLRK